MSGFLGHIQKFTSFLLHRDFFTGRGTFVMVTLVFTVIFIFSLILSAYAPDVYNLLHKNGDLDLFDYIKIISMLSSLLIFWSIVILLPLIHIKNLYRNLGLENDMNNTLRTLMQSLFGDKDNRELIANQYNLQTFLKVAQSDNDRYIIFGKLDQKDYEDLYSRFCDISDEIIWTKDESLFDKKEIKRIIEHYEEQTNIEIFTNDNNIFKDFKKIKGNLLTKYDERFLVGSSRKKRILVVEEFDESFLENWNKFLSMLNTDNDSIDELDEAILKKRLKSFWGDSELYIVERNTLKQYIIDTCINDEDYQKFLEYDLQYEFGVYRINSTLYTLKTIKDKCDGNRYNVSIEVESGADAKNGCNTFYKDVFMNTKPHQSYELSFLKPQFGKNKKIKYIK